MYYFQSDHKVGFALTQKLKDEINNYCDFAIGLRTFYKLWNVNLPEDRYVCMVRHPYEVITSAFFYHQICNEEWAKTLNFNYYSWYLARFEKSLSISEQKFVDSAVFSKNGLTYQERLKGMSIEDGLIYEMDHVSRLTIEGMYEFQYFSSPNVLVVRFEDFMDDYDGTISSIIEFLGIADNDDVLAKRLQKHDLRRIDVKRIQHVTNKGLIKNRYKTVFTPAVYSHFEKSFPSDTLSKLGYGST